MPSSDDIFDDAWGEVANEPIEKFDFLEGVARDFGLRGLADRMRAKREFGDSLHQYIAQNYIDDPNAMANIQAAQEQARQRAAMPPEPAQPSLAEIVAMVREQMLESGELGADEVLAVPEEAAPEEEPVVEEELDDTLAVPNDLDADPSLTTRKPEPPKSEDRTAKIGESFKEPESEQTGSDYSFSEEGGPYEDDQTYVEGLTGEQIEYQGKTPEQRERADAAQAEQEEPPPMGEISDLGKNTVLSMFERLFDTEQSATLSEEQIGEALTGLLKLASDGNPEALKLMQWDSWRPGDRQYLAERVGVSVNELKEYFNENTAKGMKLMEKETAGDSTRRDILDNPGEDLEVKTPSTRGLDSMRISETQIENTDKVGTDDAGNLTAPPPKDKEKAENFNDPAFWSIVKDPFANPFDNPTAFDLNEEKPPEVTQDTSPIYEVDTNLMKGPTPEDALSEAGFDTRKGDDLSLLPSSALNQGTTAPIDNTSLLPKGWKNE